MEGDGSAAKEHTNNTLESSVVVDSATSCVGVSMSVESEVAGCVVASTFSFNAVENY